MDSGLKYAVKWLDGRTVSRYSNLLSLIFSFLVCASYHAFLDTEALLDLLGPIKPARDTSNK